VTGCTGTSGVERLDTQVEPYARRPKDRFIAGRILVSENVGYFQRLIQNYFCFSFSSVS
jgi:hypothetical protein